MELCHAFLNFQILKKINNSTHTWETSIYQTISSHNISILVLFFNMGVYHSQCAECVIKKLENQLYTNKTLSCVNVSPFSLYYTITMRTEDEETPWTALYQNNAPHIK